MTKGRRIHPDSEGRLSFQEGDYGFDPRANHWIVRPPGCHAGGIPEHQVTEYDDGTITASPSILLHEGDGNGGYKVAWHGYLERGIWREV